MYKLNVEKYTEYGMDNMQKRGNIEWYIFNGFCIYASY